MNKIIIFGNSGSGKSTLAKSLGQEKNLSHLDLDTLAWQENSQAPIRRSLPASQKLIDQFIRQNDSWVIEGCYGDLIEYIASFANEMIFLNPTTEQCIKNAKNRPWEPHKYESKEKQDANLDFLISWIRDYDKRDGVFSRKAHLDIFSKFSGNKKMIQ
jgi:adenylate kinase family enzyme